MSRGLVNILMVFWLIVAVSVGVFVFSTCGWKAIFLGNGSFFAAASGMCDE